MKQKLNVNIFEKIKISIETRRKGINSDVKDDFAIKSKYCLLFLYAFFSPIFSITKGFKLSTSYDFCTCMVLTCSNLSAKPFPRFIALNIRITWSNTINNGQRIPPGNNRLDLITGSACVQYLSTRLWRIRDQQMSVVRLMVQANKCLNAIWKALFWNSVSKKTWTSRFAFLTG